MTSRVLRRPDAAGRALSAALGARRRAVGLTQPQLAAIVGVSITTIGHAETGRMWQSRDFWERADKALDTDGLLLRLHDDYRKSAVPAAFDSEAGAESSPAEGLPAADPDPDRNTVTCITITWGDGTTTIVRPSASTSACHVDISKIHETS
jgi:transcriptional regulator with XRE-family HTH domain